MVELLYNCTHISTVHYECLKFDKSGCLNGLQFMLMREMLFQAGIALG